MIYFEYEIMRLGVNVRYLDIFLKYSLCYILTASHLNHTQRHFFHVWLKFKVDILTVSYSYY